METGEIFSRTIEFEIDGSKAELSSGDPKEICEGSERALYKELGNWGAQSRVVHLQHGSYQGRPATLLVFDFQFLFTEDKGSGRFVKAEIQITFEAEPVQEKSSQRHVIGSHVPVVRNVSPKLLEGPHTMVHRIKEAEFSTKLGASGGPIPIQAELGMGWIDKKRFEERHRMKIVGRPFSSEEHQENHRALWTLLENASQKEGIPTGVKLATIVEHGGGPFLGTVSLGASTRSGLKLFGRPWSKPCPLIFRPNIILGTPLPCIEFDKLTDDDWQKLIRFQYPLEVSKDE
jgi:hypothetical protein